MGQRDEVQGRSHRLGVVELGRASRGDKRLDQWGRRKLEECVAPGSQGGGRDQLHALRDGHTQITVKQGFSASALQVSGADNPLLWGQSCAL